MAKAKQKKLLTHFIDHEDQEAKDLSYGAQKADCKKYLKKDVAYKDHSISGDWTPETD